MLSMSPSNFFITVMAVLHILLLLSILALAASQNVRHQVIVVGAGASGIAAATKLLENNITVLLLEAEDRIGGRVNSVKFGDGYVDMGAQWVHGEKGNIVYQMVKDLGLVEHTNMDFRLYSSDRVEIDKELNDELHMINSQIGEKANEQDEGVTFGDFYTKEYTKEVTKRYTGQPKKLKVALEAMKAFERYILSLSPGKTWYDFSARQDFVPSEGDHNLNWKGRGYKSILEILMKPHPNLKPVLNSQVEKILWSKEEGVEVTCKDGQVYNGEHVIFTPSLGVLKDRSGSLFEPSLPVDKIKAIEVLGFGVVMKVMMLFERRWWGEIVPATFLWHRQNVTWLDDFIWIMDLENNPKALSVWFTGKFVSEIETIPEETLVDGVMEALNEVLGDKYNISRPIDVIRTNWQTNQNFKGSYCYQTVESRKMKPSTHEVLAEPLFINEVPRLMIAGEATNHQHYSTVHGAIETGFREAERIINYNKKVMD